MTDSDDYPEDCEDYYGLSEDSDKDEVALMQVMLFSSISMLGPRMMNLRRI